MVAQLLVLLSSQMLRVLSAQPHALTPALPGVFRPAWDQKTKVIFVFAPLRLLELEMCA